MIESILFLIIPLLLSAFFSAAETACTSLSDIQAKLLQAQYPIRGKYIAIIYRSPSLLLSTILIGNNSANLVFSVLSTHFTLQIFGSHVLAISTGIIIFITLIFGEITPKQLALQYNQQFILTFIFPLYIFYVLFKPIAYLLSLISKIATVKLLDNKKEKFGLSTEHFIKLFYQARSSGLLESENANQITRILNMSDLTIDQIHTHRKYIESISSHLSIDEAIHILKDKKYRYIPIYQNQDKEHIIGIVEREKLFYSTHPTHPITSIMITPIFVTENKTIKELIEILRTNTIHMIIIIDEYGGLKGLVTMSDIVNYVFNIDKENKNLSTQLSFLSLNPHQFLLQGFVEITEIAEKVGVPIESNIESKTVGGYLQEKLGDLPVLHQIIDTPYGTMQITQITHARITTVIWTPIQILS